MFCPKCGKELPAGTQVCANCGATMSGSPTVIVKQNNGGCLKGCLISFLLIFGVVVGLIVAGAMSASKEERAGTAAVAAQQSATREEALENGEELMAWIKVREKQTELVRNDAFARLKGKTVILRGSVREVGKTMFGNDYFISLTVGKLNAFERVNVQFNMRESQYERFRSWNVGEIHTLRGRIIGQGDIEDDATCDLGEIAD